MIAHVVLFEPKSDVSVEDKGALLESLSLACRDIDTVARASIGKRISLGVSYETLGDKAYSYVAILEFDDASKLKSYLAHPLHERLGQLFWKVCESTMIVDAEMQPAAGASVNSL